MTTPTGQTPIEHHPDLVELRARYDRLMALGWKYLIEIAILWVLVSAVLVVAREEDWNVWVVTPIAAGIAALAFGVLYLCMPRPGEKMEEFR